MWKLGDDAAEVTRAAVGVARPIDARAFVRRPVAQPAPVRRLRAESALEKTPVIFYTATYRITEAIRRSEVDRAVGMTVQQIEEATDRVLAFLKKKSNPSGV